LITRGKTKVKNKGLRLSLEIVRRFLGGGDREHSPTFAPRPGGGHVKNDLRFSSQASFTTACKEKGQGEERRGVIGAQIAGGASPGKLDFVSCSKGKEAG